MNLTNIEKTIKSLLLNYKSWILIFIVIFFLPHTHSIFQSYFTFLAMLFLAYFSHFFSHIDPSNSSVHLYHHQHNNFFSHFIQILLEFVTLLLIIPISYFYPSLKNYFNPWIIIFVYLFYTTVHNFNYSILHVNDVHEKHHENLISNIGPDICDILFNTKMDDSIENTDHYLLNILFSFIIVFLFSNYYIPLESEKKSIIHCIFGVIFGVSSTFILLVTFYLNVLNFFSQVNKKKLKQIKKQKKTEKTIKFKKSKKNKNKKI
jgi:hypothetical protein